METIEILSFETYNLNELTSIVKRHIKEDSIIDIVSFQYSSASQNNSILHSAILIYKQTN